MQTPTHPSLVVPFAGRGEVANAFREFLFQNTCAHNEAGTSWLELLRLQLARDVAHLLDLV
eukprot:11845894-Alexandrium_andersonii.AAC.1